MIIKRTLLLLFILAILGLELHAPMGNTTWPARPKIPHMSKISEEPEQRSESNCEPYQSFSIHPLVYQNIFSDGRVTDAELRYLYKNYYTPLPRAFKASATWYGPDSYAYGEILWYGRELRRQMEHGLVLYGSGMYGYHGDLLLDNLASPVYNDLWLLQPRDIAEQPIPVTFDQLNSNQQRIYLLTEHDIREKKYRRGLFASIQEHQMLGQEKALESETYVAIVSAKSVNDFGRRFMIYRESEFVGVVVVGGEAKRDDWTGLGSPTNDGFKFDHFPLSIREAGGDSWAFDFPDSLYFYFGGDGGPVSGIVAIDPDIPDPCNN